MVSTVSKGYSFPLSTYMCRKEQRKKSKKWEKTGNGKQTGQENAKTKEERRKECGFHLNTKMGQIYMSY